GPGGAEAAFARERLLDQLAARLGLSPLELRRRNPIPQERLPDTLTYDEGHGESTHDTGDYLSIRDELLEPGGAHEPHAADGRGRVAIGVSSVGQGVRTALAQIAADQLGVPFEDVVVDCHGTDATRYGHGAFASRVTTVGGNAIAVAIADLHRRAREAAAERL